MYLGGEFGMDPAKVNPYAASVFYAVDRFASFQKDWAEFYRNGGIIITDRYTNFNVIHQGGKLPPNMRRVYLSWLYDTEYERMRIPRPDMVIYLDVPTDLSAAMREKREEETHSTADIHEQNNDYLKRCREAALQIADENGWRIVTCAQEGQMRSVEDINEDIYWYVEKWLKEYVGAD